MSQLDLGKVMGSKIHNVTGEPSTSLGLINDWAMDTSSGNVYEKTASTTWTLRGSFKGPRGIQGPQGVQGPQGPAGQDGADGADGITPTFSIDANGHLIATYA